MRFETGFLKQFQYRTRPHLRRRREILALGQESGHVTQVMSLLIPNCGSIGMLGRFGAVQIGDDVFGSLIDRDANSSNVTGCLCLAAPGSFLASAEACDGTLV